MKISVIQRKEAKERGLSRYFTGRACKQGHVAERAVSHKGCLECRRLRALRRAHSPEYAEWLKGRADRIKELKRSWYAEPKNREKKREQDRAYRLANAEKKRLKDAANYAANREKRKAAGAVWRAANKEKLKAQQAAWRAANPHKVSAQTGVRRSREFGARVELTDDERRRIAEIYQQRNLLTRLTGVEHHVDHKRALAKGGKHHPDNLQILTATANRQKGVSECV